MTTQTLRQDALRPLHRIEIRAPLLVERSHSEGTAAQIAGLLVLAALGALAIAARTMIFTPGL
jgi:hypothetical protein